MKRTHQFLLFYVVVISSSMFVTHSLNSSATTFSCLPHQTSVLLQLKQEFALKKPEIDSFLSFYSSYPKMRYWKAGSDCCSWDGVTCDMARGLVVGLDLSSSCLNGPLRSNSSLFRLLHLHKLNLAFNNFTLSPIPSELGQLSRLTHLNLSSSEISGYIPSEISKLTNIMSFDLSDCFDLYVREGELERLIQNMTNLRLLNLERVDLSFSQLPQSMANLSFLTHLSLHNCDLRGEFSQNIFQLPSIQSIDLSKNYLLTGSLPEFNSSSNLKSLDISSTSFSGKLPDSIGNIKSLNVLRLKHSLSTGTVPSSLWNLSELVELDLSSNHFKGQFPSTPGNLPKLTSLDLSSNEFGGELPSSIKTLPQLQYLNLGTNKFGGQISTSFGNLTQLTYLDLSYNLFHGNFPNPKAFPYLIEEIYLGYNNLTSIPSYNLNLPFLVSVDLSNNLFTGVIPTSLFAIPSLRYLYLDDNQFTDLGISNSSKLDTLSLSNNSFTGVIPSSLFAIPSLRYLHLDDNQFTDLGISNSSKLDTLSLSNNLFTGVIPSSFFAMPSLVSLYLDDNQFTDLDISNSSQLESLSLNGNRLSRLIPRSISKLKKLRELSLGSNNLSGRVDFGIFSELTDLKSLNLSYNSRISIANTSKDSTLPQFHDLFLSSCNISEFPNFLRTQDELENLDLSSNRIGGPIPKWFLSVSIETLQYLYLSYNFISGWEEIQSLILPWKVLVDLDLSSNFLQGQLVVPPMSTRHFSISNNSLTGRIDPSFCKLRNLMTFDVSNNHLNGTIPLCFNSINNLEEAPSVLLWEGLWYLDLHSNMLQGPLVVPPMSITSIFISNNSFGGGIDPMFCKLRNLEILDASNNLLNGTIPQCLGSFNSSLKVLNLQGNNFHGNMPHTCGDGSQLLTLDVSHNYLQGKIPQSLIKCQELQVLNLGHNNMSDKFPFWLPNLPKLQVLILSSNRFYGPIWHPRNFTGFVNSRIIDLSFNDFTGSLPSNYFKNWTSMMESSKKNKSELKYIGGNYYQDSVTLMNKGQEMKLIKILTIFVAIDLSNNRLHGEIPTTIGDLQSLIVLNLSSNCFTGAIPSSLGNLRELESLDLSNNKLSGVIPQQLISLTFLGYLNLSVNHLTGPVPQGGQIWVFPSSSFERNWGLCGIPLSQKCGTTLTTSHFDKILSDSLLSGFTWKVVAMGYVCGLIIGLVAGHIITLRRPNLMFIIFGVLPQRRLR
ncbi:receptor-like protein 34 [Ziziphus jujuba]|uniref:Receptor-like protein 34 n=1 Tax=Ziziphus jujuba TaxID=326968 RepID=A0ABM3ZTL0_ZIZJJ|nr:receptor-like protein 34 [Ziziphus jujuba]